MSRATRRPGFSHRATHAASLAFAVALAVAASLGGAPLRAQEAPATPNAQQQTEFETQLDPKQWGIGELLPDLAFVDLDGKAGRLSDYADRKALVVVVRDVGCPVGKRYGPVTAQLERDFAARDVAFLYVNVSKQDSKADCRGEVKDYGFTGRYARDPSGRFGWHLRVSSTTDLFVLDPTRRLRYRGPVDDQIVRGVTKVAPTRHFLKDALEAVLSGKAVALPALSSPGCHLAFNDEPPPDGRAVDKPPLDRTGLAAAPITFTEEAAARGLTAINQCGDPLKKRWLLECIGNGCALFDMDGDGDLDLFLVESGRVEPPKTGDPRTTDWVAAADAPCRLFENTGGGRFRDVSAASGADLRVFGSGVTAADYDGDGDQDLFVTCWGADHLLQNDGRGHFTDVTEKARVGDPYWSVGSTFFDADGDGDLDLYVANYFAMAVARDPACWKKTGCPWLGIPAACGPKGMVPEPDSFFLNEGPAGAGRGPSGEGSGPSGEGGEVTFTDASVSAGIRAAPASFGLGVVAFDQDDDGDQDVYVGNDSRANFLWDNDGHGRFTEIGDLAGCAVSRNGLEQASMGIACGDYDGDGRADLFCTNFSQDDSTLYHNLGESSFMDETGRHDFGPESYYSLKWGTEFVDFDGDGDQDLFMACGHIYVEADQKAPEMTYRQLNRVYRNVSGRFVDVTRNAGPGMARKASFRGAAFGDVDDDGDVDVVVVAQNEAPSLLINQCPEPLAHAVVLELRGAGKNPFAIGAKVTAEIGAKRQSRLVRAGGSFASSSDLRVHFGVGASGAVGGGIERKIDRLVVRWPDGKMQEWKDVAAGRRLRVVEGGALEEVKRP